MDEELNNMRIDPQILKKSSIALAELKKLALDENRRKHPTLPEYAQYIKPYTDKTANGLTRAVIDYLRFMGHLAERISVTGAVYR